MTSVRKILVINGPNLNLLGEREPGVYGRLTLMEINNIIRKFAENKGIAVKFFQSNHEGKIIDFIHKNRKMVDGIVINPGAFTHYSYAIRDALSAVRLPAVEVHLSKIEEREDFRRHSVIAPVCMGVISGLGYKSYLKGIEILIENSGH
ncbi:MAG: type II 3-dehydroquinate dehydratase [Fidelibacterota bacterium]